MNRTALTPLAIALIAAVVAGCVEDKRFPAPTSQLKVVHAAPALGAVDVHVGDNAVISALPYGRSSGLTIVPAGALHLTFRAGGNTIAQLDLTLIPREIAAVTLGADTVQISPVIPDTGNAISNRANVRMINIAGKSTAAPTLLGVLLNFPDVSADSVAVFGLDATVPSHGPLMYFNPGSFRVRIVPSGGTTVLAEAEFNVAAGQKKAIVLSRDDAGVYAVKIVTEP